MLYAIGEIALVVIGILIALQINNWNEDSKDLALEKRFLMDIQLDLKKDLAHIDELAPDLEQRIERYRSARDMWRTNTLDRDTLEEIQFWNLRRPPNTFYSVPGTYESLVSEGMAGLIQNKKIFHAIQQLYEGSYPRMLKYTDRIDARSDQIIWQHRNDNDWHDLTLEELVSTQIFNDLQIYYSDLMGLQRFHRVPYFYQILNHQSH